MGRIGGFEVGKYFSEVVINTISQIQTIESIAIQDIELQSWIIIRFCTLALPLWWVARRPRMTTQLKGIASFLPPLLALWYGLPANTNGF